MVDVGRRDLCVQISVFRSGLVLLIVLINYLLVNLPGTINSTRYFKKVGSYGKGCIVRACWPTEHASTIRNSVDLPRNSVDICRGIPSN